jgi:hypothetical protein
LLVKEHAGSAWHQRYAPASACHCFQGKDSEYFLAVLFLF